MQPYNRSQIDNCCWFFILSFNSLVAASYTDILGSQQKQPWKGG